MALTIVPEYSLDVVLGHETVSEFMARLSLLHSTVFAAVAVVIAKF